ncbi:MAG: OmpA family protein [Kofleriaceae bacterium]
MLNARLPLSARRLAGPLTLALALVAGACSKSKPAATTTTMTSPARPGPAQADRPAQVDVLQRGDATEGPTAFGPVYFEFDSTTLTEAGRAELERIAAYLNGGGGHVTIEGHTDERGTTEYNLALGQQRAAVIAAYLERLGVAAGKLDTVTYGEERPAVAGADEAAWSQNRRGAFVVRR